MEIWKPVIVDREYKYKYSELYEVSNLGRIKNSKGKILKPKVHRDGYLRINLHLNGEIENFSIHRLVLLAFDYDNFFEKAECNHKDENKSNNCLENLEWCTAKYNSNYGTRTERCTKHLKGSNRKGIRTNCKKVINLDSGIIYESIFECSKQLGINYVTLQKHINGKRKNRKYNIYYFKDII